MDDLGVISRIGQGRLIERLAESLSAVADEVVATGKPGTVTLTLKVTTTEAGDAMVQVTEQIARKPPTRAARGAFLYSVDGELYAQDPRQPTMPGFRAVETPEPEVRTAAEQAPTVREV